MESRNPVNCDHSDLYGYCEHIDARKEVGKTNEKMRCPLSNEYIKLCKYYKEYIWPKYYICCNGDIRVAGPFWDEADAKSAMNGMYNVSIIVVNR